MKNDLIDERNEWIWAAVVERFDVKLKIHKRSHYYTAIKNESVVFYIPPDHTIELFTHELLHLYLRARNVFITESLLQAYEQEPLMHWACQRNLIEKVGHYLEDHKILPLFIQSGFEREKFCEFYERDRCSQMNMQTIQWGMGKDLPALPVVDLFVHKFFAMKAGPNADQDYESRLKDFQDMNPSLFEILDGFWEKWKIFEIEKLDKCSNEIDVLATEFIHQLGDWMLRAVLAK